jgi:hypothetical protein
MKVLFTGIPGLHLDEHLVKLCTFLRESTEYRRSVHPPLKAEKFFLPTVRGTGLLPSDYEHFEPARLMVEALGLPKPVLRKAWIDALDRLLETESPSPGDDVFLAAHTVFYHQRTREFFVPVNVDRMKKWGPDVVITLLDDVEDCLDRLKADGHMFDASAYSYTGLDGFTNAVNNMRLLFDWRAIDILEAERLAIELGVPHFCMATKHPLETFASLLYRRACPVIYLSHPISEPRRRLARGEENALADLLRELGVVGQRLRRATTLIEPTTIDEFRIRKFKVATDRTDAQDTVVYLPRHDQRWPTPPDPLWVSPPSTTEHPLDPGGFFPDDTLEAFKTFREQTAQLLVSATSQQDREGVGSLPAHLIPLEIAANLIGVLVGDITSQIDARDHKLVEQADGLVVLRPVYLGNPSSGVLEEMKYFCQLWANRAPPRLGFWIYTHRDDEFNYLVNTWLLDHLVTGLKLGVVQGSGDEEQNTSTIEEVLGSLTISEDRTTIGHEVLRKLASRGIRYIGRHEEKALTGRVELVSAEAQRQFLHEFRQAQPGYVRLVASAKETAPGLSVEIREGPGISLDGFVGEILQSCNPKKGK